jgi:hypothetical protein
MMAFEPEPQLAKISTGDRCTAKSGAAICNRPEGHEGEHYDWCDEIFWRRRRTSSKELSYLEAAEIIRKATNLPTIPGPLANTKGTNQ